MPRRLAIIALAGWAAFASITVVAGADDRSQAEKVTIKGSIAYEAGGALPADSRAVVELRHQPALPDAPAAANQKIDLAGKQSPVGFEFDVERYRLVRGVTYVVRGVILSGTRVIWTSDDVKIDLRESTVDVKEIALKPAK